MAFNKQSAHSAQIANTNVCTFDGIKIINMFTSVMIANGNTVVSLTLSHQVLYCCIWAHTYEYYKVMYVLCACVSVYVCEALTSTHFNLFTSTYLSQYISDVQSLPQN